MQEDLTLKQIREFIEKYRSKWRWAKTYEKFAPHEYLLLKDVEEKDRWFFPAFAKYILRNRYKKKFYSKTYTYIDIDGYKYWTMDYPLEKTDLINREKLDGYKFTSSPP